MFAKQLRRIASTLFLSSLICWTADGSALLDAFAWKNRVLLVRYSDKGINNALNQLNDFKHCKAGFLERKLKLVLSPKTDSKKLKTSDFTENFLPFDHSIEKLGPLNKPFDISLLGLDGALKQQWSKLVSCEEIYLKIDQMPMRKFELKNTVL